MNFGANHPTIWKFIDALKIEQNTNEIKIEQYLAGQRPNPSRRIYKEAAERIKNIVMDYTNRLILDYLRGVGHNLSLQV